MIQDKKIKIDRSVVGSLTRHLFILSIVLLLIGIGLSAYATYSIIANQNTYMMIALVFGLIFLVAAIVVIIRLTKIYLRADKNEITSESFFEDNYMMVNIYKSDKKIKEEKYSYKNLFRFKVLKNYIFIYVTKESAFPISKIIDDYDMQNFLKEKGVLEK